MPEIYLGALSGTSLDSIDVVAAEFTDTQIKVLDFSSTPIGEKLADRARSMQTESLQLAEFGAIDSLFAVAFADAVDKSMRCGIARKDICALGLHGQTLLHKPQGAHPFTIQVGNPTAVAVKTGIDVVADFRSRDIAYGGQGAPLAPCFHSFAFGQSGQPRAIVNIGGIANISFLNADGQVEASFDSGPGNCLMDAWIRQHRSTPFDDKGAWAQSAEPDSSLLQKLLQDPYFSMPHPKSTCTSVFNLAWLSKHLTEDIPAAVVQATLAELSAQSIADSIAGCGSRVEELLVCGGGSQNTYLLERIAQRSGLTVRTTEDAGIDPLHVEALCFAWLARCRVNGQKIAMQKVTGAKQALLLGNIYKP